TPSNDYPATIAATWGISFKAVRKQSRAASDLLYLCAFLAPDNIRLDMFHKGAEYVPTSLRDATSDSLKLDKIIGTLHSYSLVEANEDGSAISIHRLVQAVLRDRLSTKNKGTWIEATLQMVNRSFSYDQSDITTWPVAGVVLPHALMISSFPELSEVPTGEIAKVLSILLNQVAAYLLSTAQYAAARVQAQRALAIGEAVYGPNHLYVAVYLSNLGDVLRGLGDLSGARTYYERALAITDATYGSDHPHVAINLSKLGDVLKELGDLQEARSNSERALAIGEAVYGPDHPDMATLLGNLGAILKELGDLQGAHSYLERALAIGEAVYGPDHPFVATWLNNLGLILQDLGDLPGARAYLERALAISEAVYGPDHPALARRFGNLGNVLVLQGHLKEGRSYLKRAYTMFLQYLGPKHHYTTITRKLMEAANLLHDEEDE
ncbi:MAG TPA: tetratricopeptide repeat protein, partial [Chloroflexia bacterium]|nr:tetratricopeptide repeat protein [Chloroflexia bacterium]